MTITESEIRTQPAPAPDPGPLPRRIADTFVNPGALFARLGQSPPWLDVVLVAAVVMAVGAALIPTEVYTEMMREQMAAATAQPGQPAPDPSTMATFGKVMAVVSMLLYPLLAAVVMSGILKLVFGPMLGGEATYPEYLSVYGHAVLVLALGSLVTLPIVLATGDMMRQLNLALLVPDAERSSFVFKFLTQFGIFNLWQYGLIAVGVTAINRGRVSAASAWAGVAAIYLLFALVAAVIPGGPS